MKRSFLFFLLIILILIGLVTALQFQLGNVKEAISSETAAPVGQGLTIALLPLDSRPPCTQFPAQLASLGGMNMLLPPAELLDNYNRPGDRKGLQTWLKETAKHSDAVIVSVDMLTHGSLLASRLGSGTPAEAEDVLKLLGDLHRENPRLQIYAFSIIPRLLVAEQDVNAGYQKNLLAYSVLKDQVSILENPADVAALQELEQALPPDTIQRYVSLYDNSLNMNLRLLDLLEQGTLAGLLIGQDDGQPFGLPNLVKRKTTQAVAHKPALADRVFVTRGTDEAAITLVGHIATRTAGRAPRVYVRYSSAEAAGTVMPFMPHSVRRTVEEKAAIVGAQLVDNPQAADYTLFVHIGSLRTSPATLERAARQVRDLMAEGQPVAVVDLTEDYYAHETIFPYLWRADVNLAGLVAYAGWNSTSNSIGTALTQASLVTQDRIKSLNKDQALANYKTQLEFLLCRYLDDWYFQKQIQPVVNSKLRKHGIDPYNLADNYEQTDQQIRRQLQDRADALWRHSLRDRTVCLPYAGGVIRAAVTDLELKTHLPWQRTFEVQLQPRIRLGTVDN